MSKPTYTLSLDTNTARPNIKTEFTKLTHKQAEAAYNTARKAFRGVQVVCEQTGEVMAHTYCSDEWFTPALTYGEALDAIVAIAAINTK